MLLEICSKCEILLKCCPKWEKVLKGAQNAKQCSKLKKVLKGCSTQSGKAYNPWFSSKNGHFPTFFLGNIGQENVFQYILERKNAFLGYKNKNFKKSKNCHFSKGVNLWFWYKNSHLFNLFFSGNIGQENVFDDILLTFFKRG